jgi:hypothetical protein
MSSLVMESAVRSGHHSLNFFLITSTNRHEAHRPTLSSTRRRIARVVCCSFPEQYRRQGLRGSQPQQLVANPGDSLEQTRAEHSWRQVAK